MRSTLDLRIWAADLLDASAAQKRSTWPSWASSDMMKTVTAEFAPAWTSTLREEADSFFAGSKAEAQNEPRMVDRLGPKHIGHLTMNCVAVAESLVFE